MQSHQSLGHHITLTSHDVDLFIATGSNFDDSENEISKFNISSRYYLLRCHHDSKQQQLQFGYHLSSNTMFHILEIVSLRDENWRLTTCVILKNLARIVSCLKDYAIPLSARTEKLSLVQVTNKAGTTTTTRIQKVYSTDYICNMFNATVTNMITIYDTIQQHNIPHTDQLVSVADDIKESNNKQHRRICQFEPVGRSYLPEVKYNDCDNSLLRYCELPFPYPPPPSFHYAPSFHYVRISTNF
jgi:hypothetical protein